MTLDTIQAPEDALSHTVLTLYSADLVPHDTENISAVFNPLLFSPGKSSMILTTGPKVT